MKTPFLTLALMAALTATGGVANQDAANDRHDGHQSQQDRNGEASAHGYQNPTGPDPDPTSAVGGA